MAISVSASTAEVLSSRMRRRGCVSSDARDGDALALAARQADAALADDRVVALRQPVDELVRLRRAGRRARSSSSVASGRP